MKHNKHLNINGWLILDKPQNMGSTDAVNLTRRLFNANKNGHTGTLDPFATGVLPIAFGEATKLIYFVMDGKKEYTFTLKFGTDTTTDDLTGEPLHSNGRIPSKEEILQVLPSFLGDITQIPPQYSAIKIDGKRAYQLARHGENVKMPQREVHIFSLELLDQSDESSFDFRCTCSKGTYIRTLGHDIALKLNTFGHLTSLRRLKCGIFSVSDTILLENLKNMAYKDSTQDILLPVETALRDIAALAVSEKDAAKLKLGQGLSPSIYDVKNHEGEVMAAFDGSCLVALVRIDERKISPIRVFNFNNKENKDVDNK